MGSTYEPRPRDFIPAHRELEHNFDNMNVPLRYNIPLVGSIVHVDSEAYVALDIIFI
jgi:hypothetical protein